MSCKAAQWAGELRKLSSIADTQPHVAYAALTHGLISKWMYLTQTIPNIGHLLQPLEDVIWTQFIPALTGRAPPSDSEQKLFALPARLGGLGLCNPASLSTTEYPASRKVTEPLCDLILNQNPSYPPDICEKQFSDRVKVHSCRHQHLPSSATYL